MSDTKVKLRREVAEAIEKHRRFSSDRFIVYKCFQSSMEGNEFDAIPDIDVDTLIRALYIGYEVEETPEEVVKGYYARAEVIRGEMYAVDAYRLGLKDCARALGFNINWEGQAHE